MPIVEYPTSYCLCSICKIQIHLKNTKFMSSIMSYKIEKTIRQVQFDTSSYSKQQNCPTAAADHIGYTYCGTFFKKLKKIC